jgi:hypothetical protein
MAIDWSKYSTLLFMDSMVALEAKPLPALPWKEIDATGPILVLVVPQVMKEIDKRKRDGRLGKRAREFNRLIGPAAESDSAVQISLGPPQVDIAFAKIGRIDWDALQDLDPEEGDARVVAQVLNSENVPAAMKMLFSYDNNPIAMAARHGVKARKLPEHWLLEPEPSPHEKELFKLRSKVEELQSTEPKIDVALEFQGWEPLQIYRVEPLSASEQSDFVARILRENPKWSQDSGIYFMRDSSYDEKYLKYRNVIVPHHVARVHRYLEDEYGQIGFSMTIRVLGHIQAENLVVTLRSSGGGLHDKFICYPVYGPVAPRPKNHFDFGRPMVRFPEIRNPVGRHDIDFAIGPDGGKVIEIHCADFRHGRTWSFQGIARLDPHVQGPFQITVEITASNLHGSHMNKFDQGFVVKTVTVSDLINLETGRGFIADFPLREQFEAALESKNNDWFDFSFAKIDDDDDDDHGDDED